MDLRWEILAPYAKLFVTGTWMTVQLTVIALVFGLMAGLMIGLVTAQPQQGLKQLLRWLFKAYAGFFRGTPLFVQILLVHFAFMPVLINPSDGLLVSGEAARELRQEHGAFLSGVLALTLNAAAYISEIVRAGIESIPKGQIEAGKALNLKPWEIFRFVILKPALKAIYPALTSQFILLMLSSAVVSVISADDLTSVAANLQSQTFRSFEIYIVVTAIYLALALSFSALFKLIYQRVLNYPDRR